MKKAIVIGLVIIVLGFLGFYLFNKSSTDTVNQEEEQGEEQETATTTEEQSGEQQTGPVSVIGKSVEGRDIKAYTFGTGENHLLFVGGIHGGYSWNTALVAYELIDYLEKNKDAVPAKVTVTVIPVVNPDGLSKVVAVEGPFTASQVSATEAERVAARFNANTVDLNRNFDCDWQADATWQNKKVSGGTAAFSEPESKAVKGYIEANDPTAVVVWYSAVGGVFASNCHSGVLPETKEITNLYAQASGYKAYEEFDFYEITGDMVNWLAKMDIPGTSVLLTTHDGTDWEKNLKGIQALLTHYSK